MTSCLCDPEDSRSLLSSWFVGRSSDFSVRSELGNAEYAQVPSRPPELSKAGSSSSPLPAPSRMSPARTALHTPSDQCSEGLESAPWRILISMTRFEWLSLGKAPGEPAPTSVQHGPHPVLSPPSPVCWEIFCLRPLHPSPLHPCGLYGPLLWSLCRLRVCCFPASGSVFRGVGQRPQCPACHLS